MRVQSLALGLATALAACGPTSGPTGSGTPSDPNAAELPAPSLVAVGPGQVAVGDTLRLVGTNFVDPDHGVMALHLAGVYTTDTGSQIRFDDDVPATYVNSGVAQLAFGPAIIFAPSSDRIGTFEGKASVINRVLDSTGVTMQEVDSDPIDVEIQVLPSILIDQLHSIDGPCQATSSTTIGGTNLALGLRAIGFAAATDAAPLRFRVSFISPTIDVQYVRDQAYTSWPLQPTVYAAPPAGSSVFEVAVTSGNQLYLDPQSREQAVTLLSAIQLGQDMLTDVKLARLATGPMDQPGSSAATLSIEVDGSDGTTALRTAVLNVFNAEEVLPYDGNYKIVERYPASPVSACFPGGMLGSDLTYSEDQTETRTRSLTMKWDVETALQVGFSGEASIGFSSTDLKFGGNTSATWTQTFGMDVEATTSSETSVGRNLMVHIIPGYFGVCYRQTERLERSVNLVYHNACGASAQVGTAVLTDWNWAFDIGTGKQCPPPTNLPPAMVF